MATGAATLAWVSMGRGFRPPIRAAIGCLLTATMLGCQSGGPVAVVNQSDADVVLRFERREVWTVPAGTTGVGPFAVATGSLVEIFASDCELIALWGIHQATTIVVEESVTLVPDVAADAQPFQRTEQCLGADS